MAVLVRGADLVEDAPKTLIPGLQLRPDRLQVADTVRVEQGSLVALILDVKVPPHHRPFAGQSGPVEIGEHHTRERTLVNRHQRNKVRQQRPVAVIDYRLGPGDVPATGLGGRQENQFAQNPLESGIPDLVEAGRGS